MKPLWLQTPAQLSNHLRSFRKARGLTQAALGAPEDVRAVRVQLAQLAQDADQLVGQREAKRARSLLVVARHPRALSGEIDRSHVSLSMARILSIENTAKRAASSRCLGSSSHSRSNLSRVSQRGSPGRGRNMGTGGAYS